MNQALKGVLQHYCPNYELKVNPEEHPFESL